MNSQISQPNYYAIIPASVRYDKDLEPAARLLYGEITALANQYGYCWATNAYFAELYDVSIRQVQNWLSSLKEKGYIEIEIEKEGIQTSRKIYLTEIKNIFTERKKLHPDVKLNSPRHAENFTQNNTHNTTLENHHHQTLSPSASPPPIPKKNDDDDFSILKKFNFPSDVLEKVRKYSLPEIQKAIEVLESQPHVQNPAGFLLRALENPEKYPLPKKYEPEQQKKESEDEIIEKAKIRRDFCDNLEKVWREYNKKNNIDFGDKNYAHYYCNFNYVEINSEKIYFKDSGFKKKLEDLCKKNNLPILNT